MFKSPMLLQSLDEPPNDNEELITELKLDGHRMILSRFNGLTQLWTRHKNNVTLMYPEVLNTELEEGTMLDGELIALDKQGKPDFEALQTRSRSLKYINTVPLQFVAFDILFFKNKQVTSKPLLKRKDLLAKSIPKGQHNIVVHNYVIGHAASYFELIKEQHLEGIVVKNPSSLYKINTRSSVWKKVINYSYTEVIITKIRNNEFGLVATDAEGKYLGIIEHGSIPLRRKLYSMANVIKKDKHFTYIKPISCRIKFREYTKNDLLRIPVLIGLDD